MGAAAKRKYIEKYKNMSEKELDEKQRQRALVNKAIKAEEEMDKKEKIRVRKS